MERIRASISIFKNRRQRIRRSRRPQETFSVARRKVALNALIINDTKRSNFISRQGTLLLLCDGPEPCAFLKPDLPLLDGNAIGQVQ